MSEELYERLGELERAAFDDLNDIGDYIWKVPRLINNEEVLEKRKLAAYFPDGGQTAAIRTFYVQRRLKQTFPRLIATSNLFLALSAFEHYITYLLVTLRVHNGKSVEANSRGIAAQFDELRAFGIELAEADVYEQVMISISIRNCLMHANGALQNFRPGKSLRRQIRQRKFLSPPIKQRRKKMGVMEPSTDVLIVGEGLSEHVSITNDYAHLVCSYLRDFFCSVCGMLNPISELRPQIVTIDPTLLAPPAESPQL